MRDPARGPGPLGARRVLFVEDEPTVALLFENELAEAGAVVLGSVGEALRLIDAAAAEGGLSGAVLDIELDGTWVAPVAGRLAALGVPFLFVTRLLDTGRLVDGRARGSAGAAESLRPARAGGGGRCPDPRPPRRTGRLGHDRRGRNRLASCA